MTEMIEIIAKTICDLPEEVDVVEIPGEKSSIIEVRVDQTDLGKMIGKGGKTAQSIRNIIYAASFKYKKRYTLEIISNSK